MEYRIHNANSGNTHSFEEKEEAESQLSDMKALASRHDDHDPADITLEKVDIPASDGGVSVEHVDHNPDKEQETDEEPSEQPEPDEPVTDWELHDHTKERHIAVDSRSAGEKRLEEWDGELDLVLFGPDGNAILSNFAESEVPHYADASADIEATGEKTTPEPPAIGNELETDAEQELRNLGGDFTAEIKGTTVIKKKGLRVMQHRYDISVYCDLVTPPEETGHDYARAKAIAEMPDGRVAEAYGSASTSRGDDSFLLAEMADTRAKSRALIDITGIGHAVVEEMQGVE